jgi:type IV fimbrial biogenesis protein FimT
MLIVRSRGFTIIELMLGLALFAIVLTLAFPSFRTMLQNAKLRSTAESILGGLQTARTEALKQNPAPGQAVEFLLMPEDPDPANVAAFTANTAGPMWAVRVDQGAGAYTFVEGRTGLEGSGQTDPATLHVQVAATYPGGVNSIRFDGMGRAANLGVANATFLVSNPAGGACKTTAGSEPMRCLRIVVTPGGRVRMCDPSVDAVANPNDTRAC